MTLLLGIDLGTSYFKVALFEPNGALKGLGRVAVDAKRPQAERMELEVEEFWSRLRQAFGQALKQARAGSDEIAGISYSSQANTCVLLDGTDAALTPLVFWNDRRAHPLDAGLLAFGGTPRHAAETGLLKAAPERASAKWRWFAQHEPGIWKRTRHALTISDYLSYSLTGESNGDASTAVLTGLYSLLRRDWWPEALATFELDRALLARPLTPATVSGRTCSRAAELLGVPAGIPFAVGALDHHAAALGAGVGSLTTTSLSIGTVLAVLTITSESRPVPGCLHGPHTDGRSFYRLAFDANGAGLLECFQRERAAGVSMRALLAQAERKSGEHAVSVHDILESTACALETLLQRVNAGNLPVRAIAATGGGTRSNFWLQLVSNRLHVPLITSQAEEPGCLGAALFAGVAAKIFSDPIQAAEAMVRQGKYFAPEV